MPEITTNYLTECWQVFNHQNPAIVPVILLIEVKLQMAEMIRMFEAARFRVVRATVTNGFKVSYIFGVDRWSFLLNVLSFLCYIL